MSSDDRGAAFARQRQFTPAFDRQRVAVDEAHGVAAVQPARIGRLAAGVAHRVDRVARKEVDRHAGIVVGHREVREQRHQARRGGGQHAVARPGAAEPDRRAVGQPAGGPADRRTGALRIGHGPGLGAQQAAEVRNRPFAAAHGQHRHQRVRGGLAAIGGHASQRGQHIGDGHTARRQQRAHIAQPRWRARLLPEAAPVGRVQPQARGFEIAAARLDQGAFAVDALPGRAAVDLFGIVAVAGVIGGRDPARDQVAVDEQFPEAAQRRLNVARQRLRRRQFGAGSAVGTELPQLGHVALRSALQDGVAQRFGLRRRGDGLPGRKRTAGPDQAGQHPARKPAEAHHRVTPP